MRAFAALIRRDVALALRLGGVGGLLNGDLPVALGRAVFGRIVGRVADFAGLLGLILLGLLRLGQASVDPLG